MSVYQLSSLKACQLKIFSENMLIWKHIRLKAQKEDDKAEEREIEKEEAEEEEE